MSTIVDELKKAIALLSTTGTATGDGNNVIFLGAPGTGKSTEASKEATALVSNPDDYIIRTVFHPASDYSSFVGCYKPTTKNTPSTVAVVIPYSQQQSTIAPTTHSDPEWYSIDAPLFGAAVAPTQAPIETSHIEYMFEPQAFLLAYMKAMEFPTEKVVLIIEEINRANCAQVFGDIFQLLDRNASYEITPNTAIINYLKSEGKKKGNEYLYINKNEKISLPPNLYLFATMNTSDQSLFPMDSAFIRRWERRYIKIDYNAQIKDNTGAYKWKLNDVHITYNDTSLVSKDTKYSEANPTWDVFLRAINWHISKASQSEDKMLGEFFVKLPDATGNPEISEDIFVNSVMSYLWDEVCKDLPPKSRFFKIYISDSETVDFSYSDYFELEKDTKSLLIARFIYYILKHYEDDAKEKCVSEIMGKAAKSLKSPAVASPAPSSSTSSPAAAPSNTTGTSSATTK